MLTYQIQTFPPHRQARVDVTLQAGTPRPIPPRFLVAVGRQSRQAQPELRFRWMGPEPSQPSAWRLGELLGPWIMGGCVLTATGRHSAGARLARALGIRWQGGSRSAGSKVLQDTQLARAGGAEFRRWLARFRGVAVRYAPNYLEWHLLVREDIEGRADPRTAHRRLPVGEKGLRLIRELVRHPPASSG